MSAKRLGDAEVGTIVKLNVDGTPTNFIVVNQGNPNPELYDESCNGTWVLAQDVFSERAWGSQSLLDYGTSDINIWLNNSESGFLSMLDTNISGSLMSVKIPYKSSNGVLSKGNGLPVKAFLLSPYEVGLDYSEFPQDGSKLDYFLSGASSEANNLRRAKFNGSYVRQWTRSPHNNYAVYFIETNGGYGEQFDSVAQGIRIAIIFPSNWQLLDTGFVTPNQPPTAPGSIDVTGVVIGEQATITLTAATDPDGTVESYIYERQVDGGEEWVQIANTDSLTCQDPVSEDWGTVTYRACAVDDKGVSGEYVTSETFEVNAGWVLISGPGENLGDKPGPFDFAFSLSVTGSTGAQAIDWSAALDGEPWDSGSAAPGEAVTLSLDTRLMATGPHTLSIAASAELFVPAYKVYTFRVPAVELPGGGRATQFKNSQGKALFPVTLGRLVIGPGGVDFNTLFGRQADRALQLAAGSYTGTGTSGAEAPTRLVFEFVPQVVLVTPDTAAAPALIWCGQSGGDSLTFARQGSALSWYASSPAAQLNESGTEYHYLALGRKEDAE